MGRKWSAGCSGGVKCVPDVEAVLDVTKAMLRGGIAGMAVAELVVRNPPTIYLVRRF